MMVEAEAIGKALACVSRSTLTNGWRGRRRRRAQDVDVADFERNRPPEIEPVVGAVAELGRLTGIATPTIDTVLALVRRLAVERKLA